VYTDLGDYAGAHIKLPGYNTLALHGGLRHGPYSFELYANNVTNTEGLLAYSYDDGYKGTGKAVFVTPLTIGARIAAKF
jgi:outer membrane receptor protein involved in Fe transport